MGMNVFLCELFSNMFFTFISLIRFNMVIETVSPSCSPPEKCNSNFKASDSVWELSLPSSNHHMYMIIVLPDLNSAACRLKERDSHGHTYFAFGTSSLAKLMPPCPPRRELCLHVHIVLLQIDSSFFSVLSSSVVICDRKHAVTSSSIQEEHAC
jgi:hypothetical protein